jgi:hypothetical protein
MEFSEPANIWGEIYPNHSLRYASHQQNARIGIVATSAHQNGNVKSATNPIAVNDIQKILRCMLQSNANVPVTRPIPFCFQLIRLL